MQLFVASLVLSILGLTESLKILVVFPLPSKSHYFLGNEFAKGLAAAGHEVTYISAFNEPKPQKNYKQIVIADFETLIKDKEGNKHLNLFNIEHTSPVFQLVLLDKIGNMLTEIFFKNSKIQEFLKSDEHFDVVVIEQFWDDALKVLAYHFKAHLILFSTIGPCRWVNNPAGNPEPASYIPDVFLSSSGEMTFYERSYNFLFGLLSDFHQYFIWLPRQNALLKQYYPNAPDLNTIIYNVSLVFTNSHESINQAVPHVPNMIDIGGYHVNPTKELPNDLKDFMDGAKEGVIYFSMGSNLQPSQMPKEKKEAILKVLGARKEKVLWKWDEDTLENKPSNVLISKWFPQQAVLGHPNCKLFITHGGLLSTTETIYLGVPVLAFPIFGDQKLNAARAASLGFGKAIAFSQISEENVAEALEELLTNPKYAENARYRSRLLHDRPVKPIDLVNYWIQYVVRHNGAEHLRVAGRLLPLYKYYMLDVIGAILGALSLFWLLAVALLRKMCSKRKQATSTTGVKKGAKSKKKRE